MILDKLAVFSGMATMWISDMVGSVVSSFEIGPVAACAIRSTGVAADNRLATDLYVSLKDYYGSIGEGFDVEAVATALEILARQEDKAPLVAVLKILVERQRQDETISGLTEAIRQLDARLKEIQGVMPARRGVAGSPRLQLPSPPQKPKIALMGRKTPFMHDQLGVFHRFLEEHGYTGNESILYAQAERCWRHKRRSSTPGTGPSWRRGRNTAIPARRRLQTPTGTSLANRKTRFNASILFYFNIPDSSDTLVLKGVLRWSASE